MSRYERLARRWRTWGGLVCVIAVGNAIAALNWYSIAVAYARDQTVGFSSLATTAQLYAERYAFLAVMLLLIGLRLVDRRADEG